MSGPVDEVSIPLHEGPSKRKRDTVARTIIDDFPKRLKTGGMSPGTEKDWQVLFDVANRSLEQDDVDQDLLLAGWESFTKAADSAHRARAVEQDRDEKLERLERRLADAEAKATAEADTAEIDSAGATAERARLDMEFHTEIGDWTARVFSRLKELERTSARETHRQLLELLYKGKGLSSVAHTKSKDDTDWEAIKGRQTTDFYNRLVEERERVVKWQGDGALEDSAPTTPFLDRIELICKKAGISRPRLLSWLKVYSDRNEQAHRAPPSVKDFQHPEGTDWESVDWTGLKEAIEGRRADVEARYATGAMDEEQRDVFLSVIDRYWSDLHDGYKQDGTPIPSDLAKKLAKEKPKKNPPANYPKNYKKGKWDDILN